jgi:sugar phosphate isomerase/epimerase
MDRAVAVGSPSIRVNTGPTGGRPFDVRVTADSFRQIAEYGQQVGVTVLVENHGTPIPNVVAIVDAVNHPRCRSLVDFGNTTPSGSTEEKIASLRPMFPRLGFVSAKAEAFDEAYRHTSWDFAAFIRAVEESGYRGIYSLELWNTRNPPADTPRAARAIRDLIAANLRA